MKFAVQPMNIPNCKMRLGELSEFKRLPNTVLLTPLLLLYTKGGSVTHLTREVLDKVTNISSQALQIPLANSDQCYNAMKNFPSGISSFVGLPECLSYCTVQDPAEMTRAGYNEKNSITIWTQTGRKQLTADKYMDMMEAMRPDWYHTLCDGDTGPQSSNRRTQKAVDVTTNMFIKCADRHANSPALKNSSLLAVIEGGYDLEARQQAATAVSQHPLVDGFVIDGLHGNGAQVENIEYKTIQPVITEVLNQLPADKPRIVHGGWRPDVVLDLVHAGVDVFDSSLVYLASERGSALTFTYSIISSQLPGCNGVSEVNGVSDVCHNGKPETLDDHVQCKDDKTKAVINGCKHLNNYEMNLNDKKFFDDLTPVVDGCSCLTCSKHTRSYIHHLLNTREMLASVLLMIHNLHHYHRFFEAIQESGRRGEVLTIDPY